MVRSLKRRCAGTTPRYTTRDSLISAGVLLLGTIIFLAIGELLAQSNARAAGEVVTSLAFPLAMTMSMPFALLKGQPVRAQVVLLGIVISILAFSGWLSTQV